MKETKIKVNDIMVNSWGYDQTNIDFYKVVGLTPKGIKVRKLGKSIIEDGFMCGKATPLNDFANDKIMTKKIYYFHNKPHITMSYGSCSIWDNKPESCSWYA